MERVRLGIAEKRAHTDASLGAERASADADKRHLALVAQRVLDDMIECDRVLADERLLKFREASDGTLARQRLSAPARTGSIVAERQVADEDRLAEREVTDALVARERLRADSSVELTREEHEATNRSQLEARREDTDTQLSTERGGADITMTTLSETQDALAQARRLQSRHVDVFGMVTHDLRSPLCIISINARCIDEATRDPEIREAAQEMGRAAGRMDRLLTDLLDVARIDSATLRMVERPTDIVALANEVFRSYLPLFEERRLIFTLDVPPHAIIVSLDRDRIVQVLSNLLGNAMKFVPAGGTISLGLKSGAGLVEISLRDTGPGIQANVLPHVLERFCQVDNDTRRGLGLGLYICKELVEAHGGRLWVESEFGKGTLVRFTLPASGAVTSTV